MNPSLQPTKNKTYVLVHGAWQGDYVWQEVRTGLEAEGYRVLTVALPGHGEDNTPLADITLEGYRDKVVQAITRQEDPVVLVGHSMGGMVISLVAEQMPARIEKLVYLAAYLSQNGDDLLSLSGKDTESITGANLEPAPDLSLATIESSMIGEIFCGDGTEQIKKMLVEKHKAEPLGPFQAKVILSEVNFGSVPKCYIHTLKDRAVGYSLQQLMVQQNGKVRQTFSIDSSHFPFLSKPREVTSVLLQIGEV